MLATACVLGMIVATIILRVPRVWSMSPYPLLALVCIVGYVIKPLLWLFWTDAVGLSLGLD